MVRFSCVVGIKVGAVLALGAAPFLLGGTVASTEKASVTQCRECHAAEVEAWSLSHHAQANHTVGEQDREAFERGTPVALGTAQVLPKWTEARATFSVSDPDPKIYQAGLALGVSPLVQYLAQIDGGRWQTQPVAYDPARREWFNATDGEPRKPGEWNHWLGRGLNWNSQCAFCHTTGLEKGYQPADDTYRTRWAEQGVGCAQCHKNLPEHVAEPKNRAITTSLGAERTIDNCASCHSRREELTGRFKPGDAYADHFRIVLPDTPGVYHPDGQILEEDFEYGSFSLSRMAQKGVTCLDCHEPHSGKTRLPATNNVLCLQCHGGSERLGALTIKPETHTFHKEGTYGSLCVDCHMPQTTYMQRHARRDHGFTVPDPGSSDELGTPNACTKCHAEQPASWAAAKVKEWYGEKPPRVSHQRAWAVARVQAGDSSAVHELSLLAAKEENSAWRATLVALLESGLRSKEAVGVLKTALSDSSPWVRAAAVRALGVEPRARPWLVPLLKDPSRAVRLETVEALTERSLSDVPAESLAELRVMLENQADQPAGALKLSHFELLSGNLEAAELWARRALAGDPSPVAQQHLDLVLKTRKQPR